MMPLTWLFVVEHNEKPNHATFLRELGGFFDPNQFRCVNRQVACVIFANNSGIELPGRTDSYGCTSLILPQSALFAKSACYVTYSNGGPHFRGNDLVKPHRDVLFRERGPCIHSFIQVNPGSIVPGIDGLSIVPVENPFVFPIDGRAADPRTPSKVVPGAVKWLNDNLDEIPCLSVPLRGAPLESDIAASHQLNVRDLRKKEAAPIRTILALSNPSLVKIDPSSNRQLGEKNADEWEGIERKALEHVVHTLDIFRVSFADTNCVAADVHAELSIRGEAIELIAVLGDTHEQSLKHAERYSPQPRRKLLVVSRDNLNSTLGNRERSFLRSKQIGLRTEGKFTDPENSRIYLGFQELLEEFKESNTPTELEGGIYGRLA